MNDEEHDFGFSFTDEQEIIAIAAPVDDRAERLRSMIMPLLMNLKKNPEKEYIHWPNRGPIIDKQIEKITAITRG